MGLGQTVLSALHRVMGYRLGGIETYSLSLPPSWGYQNYLQAYGQIGWLYAGVSCIAKAVAKAQWRLYRRDGRGDREELAEHPLIDLFNNLNPFQSRYQFFYLHQLYKHLVGESFWVLNFNRRNEPAEIWLAPPAYMVVVPSPTGYIDHYEYRRAANQQRLELYEVIHIFEPDPAYPYRGISAARSLTAVLDAERNAASHQNKLFFNDGTPGFMVEFPDTPSPEERKNLMAEWEERHRGVYNAHKTGFLWGGAKVNAIALSPRQMEFEKLRRFDKDAVLGALGVPLSVVGINETVSRINAEAGEYTFANNVVAPQLIELREALNKDLCSLFEDDIELDFDNPVPANVEQIGAETRSNLGAGLMSLEEARQVLDLGEVDPSHHFVMPVNLQVLTGAELAEALPVLPAGAKGGYRALPERRSAALSAVGLFAEKGGKDAFWKAYVSAVTPHETKLKGLLQRMWAGQRAEALVNLVHIGNADQPLLDRMAAKQSYSTLARPVLEALMRRSISRAVQLIPPRNPHTGSKAAPDLFTQAALNWLLSRIGWAADEVTAETERELAQALADGFAAGEAMREIAKRVEAVFDGFDRDRALLIARTEVIAASAQGAIEGYRASEAVEQVEFFAALDERVCPDCEDLHEEIFALEDAGAVIPVHPSCRCHPGDTLVTVDSDLMRGYRRWYEGDMIEITTALGHHLAGTPNHPVLTNTGWVAMGLLQEGDYVISSPLSKRVTGGNPNINHVPTRISEIFDSLAVVGRIERVRGTPVDFHGDGRQSQIDTIPSHNTLPDRMEDLQASLSIAALTVPEKPTRFENSRQGHTTSMPPSSANFSAFPCGVISDRIINTVRRRFSGHVYNLQTESGWYVANTIISHNCVWLPIVAEEGA